MFTYVSGKRVVHAYDTLAPRSSSSHVTMQEPLEAERTCTSRRPSPRTLPFTCKNTRFTRYNRLGRKSIYIYTYT